MQNTALITGITGQDGSYLAQLLLEKGYRVYGTYRRSASLKLYALKALGIAGDIEYIPFDLIEFSNILRVVEKIKPTEIYNLAAQSFVGLSFEQPIYTGEINGLSVTRLLEVIRVVDPNIRFYQASTSEMFGKVRESPQVETTPFYPRSPYGCAKLYAHFSTVNYREAYQLHASCGILFNHESPFRGIDFVTRKITYGLASVKHQKLDCLELGNLDAKRDWGFAKDYVTGMHAMLQQDQADDYILATNTSYSVADFVSEAAKALEINLAWEGDGPDQHGIDKNSGRVIVKVNPIYYRPSEVHELRGCFQKAQLKLDWHPTTSFQELVQQMAIADEKRVVDNEAIAILD